MTVYKYFMKIAFKNRLVILGYAGIFFLLAIIGGSSTENKEIQFVETELDIGIIDNENSELSRGLINYLKDKHNIVDTKEDEEYIKEQIFLEVADGVIVIPKGFDEYVINKRETINLYKDDRKMGANYLEQQIDKYLIFANGNYQDGNFDLKNVKLALEKEVNVKTIEDSRISKNTSINSWFKSYYNFTSYIIIGMYVSIIGLVMTEFKENKIKNRTKISSKKLVDVNMEIYLGQISLGAIITSVFVLGSLFINRRYLAEVDISKYIINIIVFSFSILCFTFLINNLTGNRFIINGIGTVVSLGTSFISGVFVPQEFLGDKVLNIAKLFPSYYFVRINESNISSFNDIKYEILMQISFGIVFLLIGLYFSKVRQKA